MTVCLQGGNEFSPACLQMDSELVAGAGLVVVTALAGAPGREDDTANRNGVAHYRASGADEVLAAPDVRSEPAAALALLRRARVLVLPGGSPGRLLDALGSTPVGGLVTDLLAAGGTVIGSSAGAMVLGATVVLPDRGLSVLPGLGCVPDVLVIPHWRGSSGWLAAVDAQAPAGALVLGIPEESGVVVRDGVLSAVGVSPTQLVRQGRALPVGSSWTPGTRGTGGAA